ncbi:glutamate-gated chloride channel isoform X2 [Daktulosphaira vitifoliae]|nr:glutamate-gated chloride channel isoform X2 [Daktulosphaira vitifoliae]XP_050524095.1 glutamate-gated chloride channel isoform X2 [Daktulosphaira vitifoliae]
MKLYSKIIYLQWSIGLILLARVTYSDLISKDTITIQKTSNKNILDSLFDSSKYDKTILPIYQKPLIINNSIALVTLSSPDETSLKYEIEFLLSQEWYDERLQFNNRNYTFLNGYHYQNLIWLPKVNFHMNGDFKPFQRPAQYSLNIFENGRVEYTTRHHLLLNCQGFMNVFPFDTPLCTFSMESISYENIDVKYQWDNNKKYMKKYHYFKTVNAYLERNRTNECDATERWRGNFSCLQVDLIFSRDKTFYISTIFIPSFILVTSSFITFFLEWNAVPARTIIGVTTMLNYFTTSNSFRRTLPDVANLVTMNVWDGVGMFFVYASFIEFVVVNFIGRRKPNLKNNRSEKKEKNYLENETTSSNLENDFLVKKPQNEHEQCKKVLSDSIRVAKTIDKIAQITFPLGYGIFLIFFFVYHYINVTYQSISL